MATKIVRRKRPIVSPLEEEPTLFSVVSTLGEDSERLVSLQSLRDFAFAGLPDEISAPLAEVYGRADLSAHDRFGDLAHRLKDFLRGVRVVKVVGEETSWLPIAEVHRPKVQGCLASFSQSYTRSGDYGIKVKVFGFGGSVSKSRSYGFADTTETDADCIQFRVPVTVRWEECLSNGFSFVRPLVLNIGEDYKDFVISGPSDQCGVPMAAVRQIGWWNDEYAIPKGVKRKKKMSVEAGQAMEASLEVSFAGVEAGPKAVVKSLKSTAFEYSLAGPRKYLAYLPKNKISYCWSWG